MHHNFLPGVIASIWFPITVRKMATILHWGWFSWPSTPQFNLWFPTNFYKNTKKSQKYFYFLYNSKEESRTVNYGITKYKSRRRPKGPRRPTEPSDLLDFEKAVELRQGPQPFRSFLHGPRFIYPAKKLLIITRHLECGNAELIIWMHHLEKINLAVAQKDTTQQSKFQLQLQFN